MVSSQTLTLDSTDLFFTAQSSICHQSPPPLFLSPFPSTFPQSKYIPKTRFAIDAFRHAGDYSVSYFLSHFHSDHYGGLSSNWSKGIVFCSHTTARLLSQVLKVSSVFIVGLPLRETILIDGCEVVLVDANHCPGAVQFLFKVPSLGGKIERYVHTGDFRFCSSMNSDPLLREFVGSDTVFLDTTYCNPKFVFPLQEESIDYIVRVIEEVGGEYDGSTRNVLFLVATYVIGKEKILLEIARRCLRKVHVDARKLSVLRALGYEESGVFTEDEGESDVHVVGWNVLGETWPYFRPNFVKMSEMMFAKGYSRTVGFVPTGWTYEVKRDKFSVKSKDSFEIHLVPYSEHSNYDELREYVRFLKPKRVVPTVGLDVEKLDSKHASKMKKHFAGLLDEMAMKQEFLRGFHQGLTEVGDTADKDAENSPCEKQHQEKDESTSDMKCMETNDIGIVLEDTFPLRQPDSQNLSSGTDKEVDKVLEALHDSLPSWVTQDQMLSLIHSYGMDIVDVVSSFYEHETEFYEQVFATKTPNSISQPRLQNDSTSLPNSDTVKSGPFEKMDIRVSQSNKSLSAGDSFRSGISPGRRKRNTDNKQNKKVKIKSKLETSGSKQSTITRFFSKVTTVVSKDTEIRSVLEESPKDKILACDATKYSNKIDQFIQIVNGNESLKSYVANILVKTKGDINQALDLYYQNPENKTDEIEVRKFIPSQHGNYRCPFGQKEIASEKVLHTTDLSIRRLSVEDVDAASVSIPLEKYNPVENACWNGQPAPYLHLARTFDLLEEEKGKIKATSMLCNMFRSLLALSPDDVLPAVYLCTNKIAADHENMELNIGWSLVTAALEEACGTNRLKIREMYNGLGDLGDVAQACRQTQTLLASPSPLLIRDVLSALQKIRKWRMLSLRAVPVIQVDIPKKPSLYTLSNGVQTGSGSTARKKNIIVNLMRSCREKEMKFLVRTLVRNLRIGAMIRTILPALAQAVAMISLPNFHHEQRAEFLKEKLQCLSAAVVDAYNVVPSLDLVVTSLMKNGIEFSSSTLSMVPGVPIKPMLAKITNGVSQALKLFENKAFTCEYKYDGQRAQIHKLSDGSFRVFSRNGDESTSRFPDLINIIKESCNPNAEAFILDAEVVAIDRKNGCKLMSFQELSSRGRGSKDSLVDLNSIKVAICVFVFDIMLANGKQLLGAPLRQRRKYFKELFCGEKMGYLEFAKEITVEADDSCLTNEETLTKINSFLESAFLSSCEGIMVKSLDVEAGYCPSKRTDTWLKVKRDYVEGLNDSLDLVPIGAWHGNGRKAGWYSPFLMACYNPDTEEYQSICRVMSGFSDSFYKEMKVFFSGDKVLSKKPPYYRTGEVPDMWFSPELVWEIRGADFTVSPIHEAAIGLAHPSRGISIRFPRFLRTLSDRKPDECSTAADVVELFHSQTRKMDVTAEG